MAEPGLEHKPKIVCLCGSTRFKEEFEEAERFFTLTGKIVLTVGLFGHADGLNLDDRTKHRLDTLHLRKIDLADWVHVINPCGYIGESTRKEIAYAERNGKRVTYWEAMA